MQQEPSKIRLKLSPQAERYARRDAPRESRLMAARGALPLPALELATVLFALMHDPDAEVKSTARDSLEGLPESVLGPVLSRTGAPRPALAPGPRLPRAGGAARADRAQPGHRRRHHRLPGRPALQARGRHRLEQPGADDPRARDRRGARQQPAHRARRDRPHPLLPGRRGPGRGRGVGSGRRSARSTRRPPCAPCSARSSAASRAAWSRRREGERRGDATNLYAMIQKMTVFQKIKLARLGNKEARGLLVKDRNKVVAISAISSPKITTNEVIAIAQSRNVHDEVLRMVAMNRLWTRAYRVKLALATNPKCPQVMAMKFVNYLQDSGPEGDHEEQGRTHRGVDARTPHADEEGKDLMAKVSSRDAQVNARIVYWGVEGAGKTANLHAAYAKLRPDHRGELRSVPTRLDPSVSYEVLPIGLGDIAGVRTQIELVAVPGPAEQAPTRKQLLDQVDGVVLVVDSQPERVDANIASFEELRQALRAYGRQIEDVPLVVQYNKRDLADPYALEDLHRKLDVKGAVVFEAVATDGTGVLQTLSTISKRVIRSAARVGRRRRRGPALPAADRRRSRRACRGAAASAASARQRAPPPAWSARSSRRPSIPSTPRSAPPPARPRRCSTAPPGSRRTSSHEPEAPRLARPPARRERRARQRDRRRRGAHRARAGGRGGPPLGRRADAPDRSPAWRTAAADAQADRHLLRLRRGAPAAARGSSRTRTSSSAPSSTPTRRPRASGCAALERGLARTLEAHLSSDLAALAADSEPVRRGRRQPRRGLRRAFPRGLRTRRADRDAAGRASALGLRRQPARPQGRAVAGAARGGRVLQPDGRRRRAVPAHARDRARRDRSRGRLADAARPRGARAARARRGGRRARAVAEDPGSDRRRHRRPRGRRGAPAAPARQGRPPGLPDRARAPRRRIRALRAAGARGPRARRPEPPPLDPPGCLLRRRPRVRRAARAARRQDHRARAGARGAAQPGRALRRGARGARPARRPRRRWPSGCTSSARSSRCAPDAAS